MSNPTQRELFKGQLLPSVAPFSQPTTSREAAEAIEPVTARLERQVLDALRAAGTDGLCNHELETILDLAGNTVRPRVWTLRKRGFVVDSGTVRLTPSGRRAIVWTAAPSTEE